VFVVADVKLIEGIGRLEVGEVISQRGRRLARHEFGYET